MKNRLTIAFRQKQLLLDQDPLQPVVLQCNGDGSVEYIPGTVPRPNWVDMTEFTEGLDKVKLSWSAVTEDAESGNNGTNELGSNYQKGLSVELRFFDDAFHYIYDWLMTLECQTLNSIEVRITDNDCGKNFRIFEIKTDNLEYAPEDEPC